MTPATGGVRAATDEHLRAKGLLATFNYFRGCVGTYQSLLEFEIGDAEFNRESLAIYLGELEYVRGRIEYVGPWTAAVQEWARSGQVSYPLARDARATVGQLEAELRASRKRIANQRKAYAALERAYRAYCKLYPHTRTSPCGQFLTAGDGARVPR